ncbi:MAG TPA: lipoprotein insertase outer membrane protein LolB, partial [Woeseiaceae bacterium]|nr:lipoprotein insertase outer membrane protein LolB [Woeseiaceae bacterium]
MSAPSPTTVKPLLARALLPLLLLSGCAVQRGIELPPMPDWETRRAVLSRIDDWEFKGRIGVSAGDEGFNANLSWQQQGNLFHAAVSGPLGIGKVRMEGDGDTVTVTDNDGKVHRLEDADEELREMYGWTLPVASLRYWALGLPDPASPAATEFTGDGRLARLEQRDWTVRFSDYEEEAG